MQNKQVIYIQANKYLNLSINICVIHYSTKKSILLDSIAYFRQELQWNNLIVISQPNNTAFSEITYSGKKCVSSSSASFFIT